MRFFAIRHKPSGHLLPLVWGTRGGRGFTCVEPADPTVCPPRLFTRQQDAKCALSWWLRGETRVTMSRSYSGVFGEADDSEDWSTNRRPERKSDEMEVVGIRLSISPIVLNEKIHG